MKTLRSVLLSRGKSEREVVDEIVTESERLVWRLRAEGLMRKEIADRLGKSEKTIDSQLQTVAAKLGVRGAVGLTRAAVRYGLISIETVQ